MRGPTYQKFGEARIIEKLREHYPAYDSDTIRTKMADVPSVADSNGELGMTLPDSRLLHMGSAAITLINHRWDKDAYEDTLPACARQDIGIPSNRKLIDLAHDSYAGCLITPGGVLQRANSPEMLLQRINLFQSPTFEWSSSYAASTAPWATADGKPVVPMIGHFFWRGYNLSAPDDSGEAKLPFTQPLGGDNTPISQLCFLKGGRSLFIPVNTSIKLKVLGDGTLAVPKETPQDDAPNYVSVPVCGFQYVGSGHAGLLGGGYTIHLASSGKGNRLAPGEMWCKVPEGHGKRKTPRRFFTNSNYWGRSGIFLDQRYQNVDNTPTGAGMGFDRAQEMEAQLLRQGASLGAITIGHITTITAEQLKGSLGCKEEFPWTELQVQIKAITDSVPRLSSLLKDDSDIRGKDYDFKRDVFPAKFAQIVERYYGASNRTNEDTFLKTLASTLGRNLRAAILSNLTIMFRENSAENLSLTGKLCDVENFQPARYPWEAFNMVDRWLGDLSALYNLCRGDCLQFGVSECLNAFLDASTDGKCKELPFQSKVRLMELRSKEAPEKLKLLRLVLETTGIVLSVHHGQKIRPSIGVVADLKRCFPDGTRTIPDTLLNSERYDQRDSSDQFTDLEWADLAPDYFASLATLYLQRVSSDVKNFGLPDVRWF